jgi:glucose-6-phosphate 1-dehydrogenase
MTGEPIDRDLFDRFAARLTQDSVEETLRIMQPLPDTPPPVHSYAPGSLGSPEAQTRSSRATVAGTDPR